MFRLKKNGSAGSAGIAALISLLGLVVPLTGCREDGAQPQPSPSAPVIQVRPQTATPPAGDLKSPAPSTPRTGESNKPSAATQPGAAQPASGPTPSTAAAPGTTAEPFAYDRAALEKACAQAELPVPPDLAALPADLAKVLHETISKAAGDPSATNVGRLGCLYHALISTREDSEKAISCYEKARALEPQSYKWPYLLGRVFLARESTERARKEFTEAARLNPDYVMAYAQLGELELERKSGAEAKGHFQSYLEKAPNDPAAHAALAIADLLLDNNEAAYAGLQHALELDPNCGRAYRGLSEYYKRVNKPLLADRSQNAFRNLPLVTGNLRRDPLLLEVWRCLGPTVASQRMLEGFASSGDMDSATLLANTLVADHPQDAQLLTALARCHELGRHHDEAIKIVRQALAIQPAYVSARVLLARCLTEQGKTDEALAELDAALTTNPDFSPGHFSRGTALASLRRFADAEQAFRRTHELQPNNGQNILSLADVLVAQDKLAEAAQFVRESLQERADRVWSTSDKVLLLMALGRIQGRNGQTDEGLKTFKHVLELDDGNAYAFTSIIELLLTAQRGPEAEQFCKAVLERSPGNPWYLTRLARVLTATGRDAEAMTQLRQAQQNAPEFAEAAYALAELLNKQGQTAEAITQLQNIIKNQPGHVDAHGMLATILCAQKKHAEAATMLREGLRVVPENAAMLNSLAWVLATNSAATPAELEEAVKLGERSCAATGQVNANFLDTLAVAYAANGRFDEAVQTERRAIAASDARVPGTTVEDFRKRLQLFEQRQSFREQPK